MNSTKPFDPEAVAVIGKPVDDGRTVFNCILVGMKFHPPALEVLDDMSRNPPRGHDGEPRNFPVKLTREPRNPYDKNAIQVCISRGELSSVAKLLGDADDVRAGRDVMLGYISKNQNSVLATRLDQMTAPTTYEADLGRSTSGQWWVGVTFWPEGKPERLILPDRSKGLEDDDEIPF
jgi:hypothetical protein